MKNRLVSVCMLVCILLLSACGSMPKRNPEYEEALSQISSSEGAYDVFQKYKDNTDAMAYILKKIPANDVSKLMTESNPLYGYSIIHASTMGDIIKIMLDNGFENFSKDVILSAFEMYLPTTLSYNESDLASLSELNDKEFYAAANELYSSSYTEESARNLLLTEAYNRAESKLKNAMKNPSSYKMISLYGTDIDFDPETGEYFATINIEYSGTNSFGGTVRDTFTYYETGTFINGKINYKGGTL